MPTVDIMTSESNGNDGTAKLTHLSETLQKLFKVSEEETLPEITHKNVKWIEKMPLAIWKKKYRQGRNWKPPQKSRRKRKATKGNRPSKRVKRERPAPAPKKKKEKPKPKSLNREEWFSPEVEEQMHSIQSSEGYPMYEAPEQLSEHFNDRLKTSLTDKDKKVINWPDICRKIIWHKRFSWKETRLIDIGSKTSNFVQQRLANRFLKSWDEANKTRAKKCAHNIWLDPSGPANLVMPKVFFRANDDPPKIITGKCPTELKLGKEFGEHVEFVYISPAWDSIHMGFGKRGHFTPDHLQELDLNFHKRGFVFMWFPFEFWTKILEIMAEKGYKIADSTAQFIGNTKGQFDTQQRAPDLNVQTDDPKHNTGLVSGLKIHGILFKKEPDKATERYIIGNQIMYDCFVSRRRKDYYTGQAALDHGYVQQMYQYLICSKPSEQQNYVQAIHLFCPPSRRFPKFWGGVQHYPDLQLDFSDDE